MHRQMLLEQLNPVGPLEEILAARIVDLSWRLKRAAQDQSEAFVALYDRQRAGAQEPQEPAERAATLGRMILEDFSRDAVLERLLRYERRIESSLYRTLNKLRRVHDQVQKAALEDANTLERWREEDWNARKARSFAFCPPPEDETCETNPVSGGAGWDGATGAWDAGQSCETNPIGEEVSSLKCQVASEPCKTNPVCGSPRGAGIPFAGLRAGLPVNPNYGQDAHAAVPPDGVTTNPAPAQGQSCETNPICGGGSNRQGGYTPIFRRRR